MPLSILALLSRVLETVTDVVGNGRADGQSYCSDPLALSATAAKLMVLIRRWGNVRGVEKALHRAVAPALAAPL